MDLAKVLKELHEELENLDAAISSLERLQEAGQRRGRSADWLDQVNPKISPPKSKRRGRPKDSK
jgi:hypothetical protein